MMCREVLCPGAACEEKPWEPRDTVETLRTVVKEGMPSWLWWTLNKVADLVVWVTGGPRGDSG